MTEPSSRVPHAPGCECKKAIHRYRCRHCKRVFGWCLGADDELEREIGPICDTCWDQHEASER